MRIFSLLYVIAAGSTSSAFSWSEKSRIVSQLSNTPLTEGNYVVQVSEPGSSENHFLAFKGTFATNIAKIIGKSAAKQEIELRETQRRLDEQHHQELILARELAEKDEGNVLLEEQYTSLQDEVDIKTKKLNLLLIELPPLTHF